MGGQARELNCKDILRACVIRLPPTPLCDLTLLTGCFTTVWSRLSLAFSSPPFFYVRQYIHLHTTSRCLSLPPLIPSLLRILRLHPALSLKRSLSRLGM